MYVPGKQTLHAQLPCVERASDFPLGFLPNYRIPVLLLSIMGTVQLVALRRYFPNTWGMMCVKYGGYLFPIVYIVICW